MVLPLIGAAASVGIGALGGIAKYFFNRSAGKRAQRQYEDLSKQAAERHKQAISSGEQKSEELYGKYALDPTALKNEYSQAMQRQLQQQAGGMTAGLASLRGGINPALASHLLTGRAAEMGAQAAGQEALAQSQISMQTDMYNKQLAQQLRNQEIGRQMDLANIQQGYAQQGAEMNRQYTEKGYNQMFDMFSQGAAMGMNFLNPASTAQQAPDMTSGMPGRYNMGIDYSSSSTFNPYKISPINPMGARGY